MNAISNSGTTAPQKAPVAFVLNRFIAANELAQCRRNLAKSDSNHNGEINATEWATYVMYESNGVINKQFVSLPLALISLFYSVACSQCYAATSSDYCCVGNSAQIGIQHDSNYSSVTGYICSTTQLIFGQLMIQTSSPTRSPTPSPTKKPANLRPTNAPIRATMAPTPSSSLGAPLCVTFFYTITNTVGLTASDILNENGNQLKTGLELATGNITTQILNATFPRNETQASSFYHPFTTYYSQPSYTATGFYHGANFAMDVAMSELIGPDKSKAVLDSFITSLYSPVGSYSGGGRRELWSDHVVYRSVDQRRLVYYTLENPAKVVNVIDDPFCPQTSGMSVNCAIVVTEVCVTLEAGDNSTLVKNTLVTGIRSSIDSGAFFQAIPPQYIPPSS